jgi:hypothetical protein
LSERKPTRHLDEIRQDIDVLRNLNSYREGKYIRNMNRYNNNGARRENLYDVYNLNAQAYQQPAQGTEGTQTQLNICKSAVDSLCSKMSNSNVRPYFTPVSATFQARQACEQAQIFFDTLVDEKRVYKKSVMSLRDAAIFDVGVVYLDTENMDITRVAPWEYYIDPAEYYHGRVTRCMVEKRHYPLAGLKGRLDNKKLTKALSKDGWFTKLIKQGQYQKSYYTTYFDLYEGFRYEFYGRDLICDPIPLEYEVHGGLYVRPFVEIYFNNPIKGSAGVSLIDDLYPIQRQIDELVRRLDAATRNAIFNIILVRNGTGLKASDIENGAAKIYTVNGDPDGAISVVTPPAINQQFIDLLNFYMEKAFNIVGISQLSAQSKKPADVESGIALQTLEDIESDRWNVLLHNYIHFIMEIAKRCVDVFPPDADILPEEPGRSDVKWSDVKKARRLFQIQFSAASSLSRDPSTKLAQIKELGNMGFIDKEIAASFLDMPDLQKAHTLASSTYEYVQKVIADCMDTGTTDYLETVNLHLLQREALKQLNQIASSNDDQKYIKRMLDLIAQVGKDIKALQTIPSEINTPAPPPPGPEGGMNVP